MKKIVFMFVLMFIFINVKALEIDLAKNAKSAILIESSTGKILYEKNADLKLPPASMTKMMSMLIILESIDNGMLSWNDIVVASPNASKMGGSQILLEIGEKMTVKDLFKGIAVASGNDAVVALAEKISGTEEAFVLLMNKRAKELGLKNTHFENCHGIDSNDHYSSARDMALIAKELVKHEDIFKYTSIYEDYLRKDTDRKLWIVNTNKLVRFYNGADGLKTGYTNLAGYCLTATAKKDNIRLIAVVMGEEDSNVRNSEVTSMLDYGFSNYGIINVLTKNNEISTNNVINGKKSNIKLYPSEDITYIYKKTEKKPNINYKIKIENLKAPLKQGDIVGKIDIYDDDNFLRTINVIVKEEVQKMNFFELYINNLKLLFN